MFPRDAQCTDNAMRYDNVKKKYIILFQINTALISDKCIQTFLTNNGYNYNPDVFFEGDLLLTKVS